MLLFKKQKHNKPGYNDKLMWKAKSSSDHTVVMWLQLLYGVLRTVASLVRGCYGYCFFGLETLARKLRKHWENDLLLGKRFTFVLNFHRNLGNSYLPPV